ncbi:MAG: 30S ribosomal protein S20 [Dehalococcoidia bacterium]
MPSKKSMRVTLRKTTYNRGARTAARMAVRATRRVIGTGNREESLSSLSHAASALDRAAKRGIIHRNNSSRRKSRLAKRISTLDQQAG